MVMKTLMLRGVVVLLALLLAMPVVLAQDASDDSAAAGAADQTDGSAPSSDQGAPAAVDVQAVSAQWGQAPAPGKDADAALARRWLKNVQDVSRDPYLDWLAANKLHSYLHEPQEPKPSDLKPSAAVTQSPLSNDGIALGVQYWTVPDTLWQAEEDKTASDDNLNGDPPGWADAHPGQPFFTFENYMKTKEWQRAPYDRFRLFGVAGHVDTSGPSTVLDLASGYTLEEVAPGSVAAYQPVIYMNGIVAVVAYDPWVNPDGSLRP
jgi:hypothetical protein